MGESREEATGLTHSQMQIWIGQRLNLDSPLYNMTFAWILPAEVRVDLFQQAWRRVADSSDALRTTIVESDGSVQRQFRLAESSDTAVCETEVISPPWSGDLDEEFRRWCRQRSAQPLALDGSLVDSVLVHFGDGRIGWYLNLHHLITDAWSTVLLYRQVAAEYTQAMGSQPNQEPTHAVEKAQELPGPLYDYYPTAAALAAKTATAKAAEREEAQEHWATRLTQSDRSVPLYGRRAQPKGTSSTRLTLQLTRAQAKALEQLSAETGFLSLSGEMSRFALFATLLLSWVHRISGRADLGFDAPVAGRPSVESKRALGLFIEMFPFAATIEPQETFRSLGAKCLAEAGLFLRHSLPTTSAPSGTVASNVVLNYFPQAFGDFAGLPADVEWVHPGHGDSVHTLRLQVHDFAGTGCPTLHFDFNDGALPGFLRHRSLQHFQNVLQAMLADPDEKIAAIDVVTEEERQALLNLNTAATATAKTVATGETTVDLFLARAAAHPERIALNQGDQELSFGGLKDHAQALAATLVRNGIQPGDRVAILAKRSIDAVVAIFATWFVRAAYVPIDLGYPQRRWEDIVQNSGASLLLLGEGLEKTQPVTARSPQVLSIALGIQDGLGEATAQAMPTPTPSDLAYVLYTSGSTGRPKGVLVDHGGVTNYLTWAARRYVRGEQLSFPLFTSLAFDLTVTSLFLPLITGGRLEIYPEPEGPVDSTLIDVVRANAVDFIKLTPSHLSLLHQMDTTGSRIRRMVVGGEDFKTPLAADIHEQFGNHPGAQDRLEIQNKLEIHNEYGPTEAVVGCVAHRYDPAEDTSSSVPIGAPADQAQVEVLTPALSPVPEGVPGELWVSQPGLAQGYLGLPALTAERFRPDPKDVGQRRSRTGDRVRMGTPHPLADLGRLDRQLQLSGHRVEPAEIEAALLTLPKIEHCAVVLQAASQPGHTSEPTEPSRATNTLSYCKTCGLPSNHPRAAFDRQGICSVCRSYEAIKEHAQGYFKTMDQLAELFEESARKQATLGQNTPQTADCMMLFSGGKDSSYALCRLVEMGLSVYAFTLDNGFISEGAKENIRRITEQLGVPVEFATTPAMNGIFRDSLARFSNVCHGCFKTIYTLSLKRAKELEIPIIVTGLSRGQMFETRLTEEMFRDGQRSPEEVDAAVLAARKVYHRLDDEVSRSLDVQIFRDDRIFEQVEFVDFYRYCDVGLSEVLSYLKRQVPWVRPEDTGRSTNCLINDLGIYVHKKQRGYHNYALPYSWDVRMGHKTRQEAHEELQDEIDLGYVRQTLAEIGCDADEFTTNYSPSKLVAYYVASEEIPGSEMRNQLSERLPTPLIPTHFQPIDSIPLTVHGKLDYPALPNIEQDRPEEKPYRKPEGPVEEYLAEVWQESLGTERIGADDSFFGLGGTSLIAMEVMIRLCREFDIDLPLETLFSHPTLSGLTRVAEDKILEDVAALSETDRQQLLDDGEALL